jgi:hypothetical protein
MSSGSEILLEEIRHKDFHSIRFLCILFFFIFSSLTYFQLEAAEDFKDYVSAPAYITDMSSRKVFRKSGVRTLYSFTVHWEYEGKEYQKEYKDVLDPHSDLKEVHIAPDNSDMTLGSHDGSIQGSFLTLATCAAAFVIWIILFFRSKNILEEVKENCYMGIGISLLSSIVAGFFYHVTASDHRYQSSSESLGGLTILSIIGLILSIIVLIIVNKRKKNH